MVHEVIKNLITTREGIYIDGTVGSGGHSEAILQRLGLAGRLICMDRDPDAIEISKKRLSPFVERVTLIRMNYARSDEVVQDLGLEKVDGILLDLGISSHQIELSGRGFSFYRDEPLDMRMDPENGEDAFQLVNRLPTKELEGILREYGEERRASLISKSIKKEREQREIDSSLQLANLIASVLPASPSFRRRHPATRSFQALRIAVNRELDHLKDFLNKVPSMIRKGGRLVMLSYHSIEDRMVKQAMVDWEKTCICPPDFPTCVCDRTPLFKRLRKKGIRPDPKEIEKNPRARSATLRAAERI
jgi:16S rRNA (cytosine1402-N4)-methyltransferase